MMATEQRSELLLPVIKEEPLEEQAKLEAECASFCFETVTKEEVFIEDSFPKPDEKLVTTSKQSSAQLPELPPSIVKEEPPEEQPELAAECSSFCYETVTKEEVFIEDEVEGNENPASADGENLKNRAYVKSKGKTFKCTDCDRTFGKYFELSRHLKWHISIKLGLNRCSYCNKTFSFKASLNRHIESHKKRWEMAGVSRPYEGESLLEMELPLVVRRGRLKNYFPAPCDQEETVEVTIEEGVEEVQDEPEPENDETSSTPIEPIAEMTEDGSFKCTECGRTFEQLGELRRHIKWHKAVKLGQYRCKYCNNTYSTNGSLRRHIRSHKRLWKELNQDEPIEGSVPPVRRGKQKQNAPPAECPECGKVFVKRYRLKPHIACHEAIKLGLFTCDLCNKRFGTDAFLQMHKSNHQREEIQYTCYACHEKFPSRQALVTHQTIMHKTDTLTYKFKQHVIQNEDGVFHCTVCENSFPNRHRAVKHFRGHVLKPGENSKGERELFICDLCGKSWKRKAEIRRHMEVHKGDRRHRCHICQMEFATLSDVVKHRVVHKMDERSVRFREIMVQDEQGSFTCTLCSRHCDTRQKARDHLRNRHRF